LEAAVSVRTTLWLVESVSDMMFLLRTV